ncbi:MAG: hypothetical protein K2N64_05780 [Anaeroplasmataceae bacterium]|nr:hypothetical protein [Anaeroplasmataceae bacterium]
MKKVVSFILFLCFLFLTGCGDKEAPAEVILLGEQQEETIYQFSKTSQPAEIKEIFEKLNDAKRDTEFNGIDLNVECNISGNVLITNQAITTIDLSYNLGMQAKMNLKKYLLSGVLSADGYVNTDSDSLSFKSKLRAGLNIANDDQYIYAQGILEDGNTKATIRHKYDISLFTQQYKAMITSFIDLMKYYKLSDFLNQDIDYISDFQIVILKTTKDTFTLQLQIPANLGIEETQIDGQIPIEIEVYCSNLLPKQIRFSADELISLWLENKYVEQYISGQVEVKKAKLDFIVNCNYDYFTIEQLKEEEKETYKEFKFSSDLSKVLI